VNPWYCWIGPYNAHCFKNDKGEYMNKEHACVFCGTVEPTEEPTGEDL
jgi:hypothetical protein